MRLLSVLLVVFLATRPLHADPIPGMEDPALQDAVARWLNEEDPIEALREIGVMASQGNLAAQFFANRVRGWRDTEAERNLSRDDFLDLFPPVPGQERRGFRPYDLPAGAVPGRSHFDLDAETPVEEWERAMISADEGGFHRRMLGCLIAANNQLGPQPEIFEALVDRIHPSYPRSIEYWGTLAFQMALAELMPERAGDEEWETDPRDLFLQSGFYEAFEAGNWTALKVVAVDTLYGSSTFQELHSDPRIALVASIIGRSGISETDAAAVGQFISGTLEHSPFMEPILLACRETCGDDHLTCMAAGAGSLLYRHYRTSFLEPIVDPLDYYQSPRAARDVLVTAASFSDRETRSDPPLPQCLIDAAPARP